MVYLVYLKNLPHHKDMKNLDYNQTFWIIRYNFVILYDHVDAQITGLECQ